jgi:hypothetical protein
MTLKNFLYNCKIKKYICSFQVRFINKYIIDSLLKMKGKQATQKPRYAKYAKTTASTAVGATAALSRGDRAYIEQMFHCENSSCDCRDIPEYQRQDLLKSGFVSAPRTARGMGIRDDSKMIRADLRKEGLDVS